MGEPDSAWNRTADAEGGREKGQPFNDLFLCTGDSAPSIMAEAIMARKGVDRLNGFSAGSHPTGKVNPLALKLLRELNHGVTEPRSKDWPNLPIRPRPR